MRAAVGLVFDDFRVTLAVEMSSLVVWVTQIPDRARALAREALYTGVHRAFTIAHSHYSNIDLPSWMKLRRKRFPQCRTWRRRSEKKSCPRMFS